MKILFISPRPFGLMGTPGTYLLVESYAKRADVCVIANKDYNDPFQIVHKPSDSIKLHEIDFSRRDYPDSISQILTSYEPDIVNVVSHPEWTAIVDYLKKRHPTPKYVLDIKSPLLSPAHSDRSTRIRKRGQRSAQHIDLVLTRSQEDVPTLIPHCSKPVLVYPLGVRLADYSPRNPASGFSHCSRFVYVGAIAPLRKLEILLEYIAALPQDIRKFCTFDFFGSGPTEGDFVKLIGRLGLGEIVSFKGCVDTGDLPGLLAEYDAGIAWVPNELYDASPSLKMVEYTAAGLLSIATSTTAHRRFGENGFHVSFFSESAESFAAAIQGACDQGFSQQSRTENLTRIREYDWDNIVDKFIFPTFFKFLGKSARKSETGRVNPGAKQNGFLSDHSSAMPNSNNRLSADNGPEPAPQNKYNDAVRILVISPRPFGILGTAGTYLLVTSYAKKVETCIVARQPVAEPTKIVFEPDTLDNFHELDFSHSDFLPNLHRIVDKFQPHVVIMYNYVRWFSIISYLKQHFPDLKCVLDVQTPLIIENDGTAYRRIRKKGNQNAHHLDLIVALSLEAIPTWIPKWQGRSLQYSLGIRMSNFSPRTISDKKITCRRFVFIGALHHLRKLDILITYIAALPRRLKRELTFDFYGDGPAMYELENLIKRNDLQDTVAIKGLVESERLSALLSEYDAGVAWVPHAIYDCNPSLKLLEYMAAGIVPLAMDTVAHKRDAKKGFHIEFFSDSADSFGAVVERVFEQGFPVSKRDENLRLIARNDYDVIAEKEILPTLSQLVGPVSEAAPTRSAGKQPGPSNLKDSGGKRKISEISSTFRERVCLWDIPLKPPEPQRLIKSRIRIAGILGNRLFKGLAVECNLLLLTPQNWESVLDYGKPDFLLVESSWLTANGYWYMAQSVPGEEHNELLEIIRKSRSLGIPTIFWLTLDSSNHEHFREFAQHFDYVFCADPKEIELLGKEGILSKTLLPAVQPVIFNPVREGGRNETFNGGILYDGWRDLCRFPEIGNTLKQLNTQSLNIFQSNQLFFKQHRQMVDSALAPFVRGSVNASMLPTLLKHASMYISFAKSTSSQTQQIWSVLEASACRLPIAYLGRIDREDPRFRIVRQFENESLFCDYVREHDNGLNHSVEQDKQKAWRETCLNHTINNRLQTICKEIGIANDWVEFPKSSLVAVAFDAGQLKKCITEYESQTYPNKELIITIVGDQKEFELSRQQYADRDDISIYVIPKETTIGEALNHGLQKSTGEYFFHIDHDNAYGPNYVLDTQLYLRTTKADFIGKSVKHLQHVKGYNPNSREENRPQIRLIHAKNYHAIRDALIVGGSLAGRFEILREPSFLEKFNMSGRTLHLTYLRRRRPQSTFLITDPLEIHVNFDENPAASNGFFGPESSCVKKVLYIGPWQFAPNVGPKNVRVIYPSLFDPLYDCEFHILHGEPELPNYVDELVEKYGVVFHRIERRNIKEWIAMAESLTKDFDIDVLTNVFFGYYHGYVAAKVAQKTRRKSVVRFAANEIYVRKCGGAYRGLRGKARYVKEKVMEISAIHNANEVIAMSPWEVKRIKKLTPLPEKIRWCMRGIDVKKYAPPHKRGHRAARNFLFVGRKRREKGYRLIETVAKNLSANYPDIRFYFAGTFEPGEKENRSYIGYCSHEKLKELYFNLDALILPSESEGFANVIVEAMSMGMPCIISRSYHKEYFKHRENALLTDLTAKDLEANILELYLDQMLNEKLGINARKLAEKEFDSKIWANRYREIILA